METKYLTAPVKPEFYKQVRIAAAMLDIGVAEFLRRAAAMMIEKVEFDNEIDKSQVNTK